VWRQVRQRLTNIAGQATRDRGAAEPGAVATELASHNRPEILSAIAQRFDDVERLQATDIADAIHYIVSRPRRMAVNEMLIRPTEQQR
jgi:NADP-dependent 3-hydroxy acid dehydrogenase YdfG